MRKIGRAFLGIPIALISGLLILLLINVIFSRVSPPLGVSDLIYQAQNSSKFGDRIFAWAILFGLFVIPFVTALKLGWREENIVKQIFFPFLFGILAAIVTFVVAFILMILQAVIEMMLGPDSIIGMGIIIALFVGSCATCTTVIIAIID